MHCQHVVWFLAYWWFRAGLRRLGVRLRPLALGIASTLGLAVSGSALTSDITALIGILLDGTVAASPAAGSGPSWARMASYAFVFAISFWGTTIVVRRTIRLRARGLSKIVAPERRPVLVLFLSNIGKDDAVTAQLEPDFIGLTSNLDHDLRELAKFKEKQKARNRDLQPEQKDRRMWRWEQPLRAIQYQLPALQRIVLVCSSQSLLQVSRFLAVLRRYGVQGMVRTRIKVDVLVEREHRIHLAPAEKHEQLGLGLPFDDFKGLAHALLELLQILIKKKGIDESDITIDFTGGMKVTSVVAAAVTFNRRVQNQYVMTAPPSSKKYDADAYLCGYDVLFD